MRISFIHLKKKKLDYIGNCVVFEEQYMFLFYLLVKNSNPSNGRNRLEQWDDFEDGDVKEMGHLTQQEYMERISQLNKELVEAWHQDSRVNALKITIQVFLLILSKKCICNTNNFLKIISLLCDNFQFCVLIFFFQDYTFL